MKVRQIVDDIQQSIMWKAEERARAVLEQKEIEIMTAKAIVKKLEKQKRELLDMDLEEFLIDSRYR